MKGTAAALLVLACAQSPAPKSQPAGETAHGLALGEILRRCRAAYASVESYQDEGEEIETWFTPSGVSHEDRGRWSLLYRNPNRLRFEFRAAAEQRPRYVVWSQGERILAWITGAGVREFRSWQDAASKAPAGNGGSTGWFPFALVRNKESSWLENWLGRAQSVSRATVAGEPCYRVQWVNQDPDFTLLLPMPIRQAFYVAWVSDRDFMLRKVASRTEHGSHYIESRTTYHPRVGHEIERQRFRFIAGLE